MVEKLPDSEEEGKNRDWLKQQMLGAEKGLALEAYTSMGSWFAEAERLQYRRYFGDHSCNPQEWARGTQGKGTKGGNSAVKGRDIHCLACGKWGHKEFECPQHEDRMRKGCALEG